MSHTTSLYTTYKSPTTTDGNEGGTPTANTRPLSSHSPASVDIAHAGNLNSYMTDLDITDFMFESAFLCSVADGGSYTSSIIKVVDTFPSAGMSVFATYIQTNFL